MVSVPLAALFSGAWVAALLLFGSIAVGVVFARRNWNEITITTSVAIIAVYLCVPAVLAVLYLGLELRFAGTFKHVCVAAATALGGFGLGSLLERLSGDEAARKRDSGASC